MTTAIRQTGAVRTWSWCWKRELLLVVGVAAVGRTADGRFVAGVQAIWTSTLPGLLDPDPQAAPDFSF